MDSFTDEIRLAPLPADAPPADALTVTDLKDFAYCPRFPYYTHCLPDVRPRTYAMDAGSEAHLEERARARRRTLWAYGLPEGERRFDVRLYDPALNLVGLLDELVLAPNGIYHPVDYKLSTTAGEPARLQVSAYGMLVERVFGGRVETGYVYLIEGRSLCPVPLTAAMRAQVEAAVQAVRRIQHGEAMPPPPPVKARGKCRACEWRRFCNDVL